MTREESRRSVRRIVVVALLYGCVTEAGHPSGALRARLSCAQPDSLIQGALRYSDEIHGVANSAGGTRVALLSTPAGWRLALTAIASDFPDEPGVWVGDENPETLTVAWYTVPADHGVVVPRALTWRRPGTRVPLDSITFAASCRSMTPEIIDPTNPVVALCAEGMAAEGTPAEARRLFELAWAKRRDDYDAAIAAHFLARHQSSPADTLHWNALAVQHAEAVPHRGAAPFLASLYLNLGDAQLRVGDIVAARVAVQRATDHLAALPPGGYREFVAAGIKRLGERLRGTSAE